MVTDENKYWFEDDDQPKTAPQADASGGGEEDLFGGSPAPAPDSASPPAAFSAPDDPHARHYRSDFAGRADVPEGDWNNSGRIKALRGHMLNKLLKYDYRALFRFLLPCYIVVVALAVLCSVSFALTGASDSSTTIRVRSTIFFLYSMSVIVCLGGCTLTIASRFQKNLFSGEGYLTLSIPATPEEHIFSKLISGVTTSLLTGAVMLASLLIVTLPYDRNLFFQIVNLFKEIGLVFSQDPVDATLVLIELIFLLPLLSLASLQLIHCCICVGQMFTTKSRTGIAVLCFFAFTAIFEILAMLFATIPGVGSFFNALGGHGTMWFFIVLIAGFDVGAFFFQRYVLKNRVNLA